MFVLFAQRRRSLFVPLWLCASLTVMSCEAQDEDRVAAARVRCEAALRGRFAKAGVDYPAEALFFRAFKREAVLEVWARGAGGPLRLIHVYPWTVNSGGPGPKRKQGDFQIPEGFYRIDAFNPKSRFHLSLRVNYPNASDRVRSDRERPGFDIYIHGNAMSVGCMALGDEAIEEVYLAALDTGNREAIPIHIFPAQMQGAEWEKLREANPAHAAFWKELQPGFDAFERTKRVPRVTVAADGRYVVEPR
jgi:murein L,D-transpeptidase YafK